MRRVLALAAKDVRLLLRDKAGAVFTFFWPLLMATFFGMMFSGEAGDRPGMPVVVVDQDLSTESKALIASLERGDEVEVTRVDAREDAEALVRRGKRTASVVVPKGYGAAVSAGFLGDAPRLVVGYDPSRKAEIAMLLGMLTGRVMRARGEVMAGSMGAPGGTLPPPVAFETTGITAARRGPTNAFSYTFAQGIVWAVLGAAAAFAASLVSERVRGTLMRLVTSPVSPTQVLAGKALACFLTIVAVSTTLVGISAVAFGVRPTSLPVLAVAIVCSAIAFVGIMMVLATLARSEAAASGGGWGVFLVMALFGGGMLPLFVMPAWMGNVSNASPVKWAILALEGGLWRGFSPGEMVLPCAILLSIGAAGFLVAVRGFRWGDR